MMKKRNDIAILILAAGSSSRLGRPKQLLELDGNTLLQKAIATALAISENVKVVLGANEKLIRPTIADLPVEIVLNENWVQGMSSSISAGMTILEEEKTEAVLIMLTDQPYVNVLLLEKLIRGFEETQKGIVASEYLGKLGVPAIFSKSFFAQLRKMEGQVGAKHLIRNNLEETERVTFEEGSIDIDTEEDWARFKEK